MLDAARARGLIPDDKANPARWRGHLEHLLSRRQKLRRKHFAAMPYAELQDFIARLREHECVPALALEFLILTAARSGEVRGALWSEFDFGTKIWTIPGERMKAGIAHRVPLSSRAIEILEHLGQARTGQYVFPGHLSGRPISNTGLIELLGNAGPTVHGFAQPFAIGAVIKLHFRVSLPRPLSLIARVMLSSWLTGVLTRSKDAGD